MQVSTDHVHPGEAVSGVRVCFVQRHHMGEVGQLGVLFVKANLPIKINDFYFEYINRLMLNSECYNVSERQNNIDLGNSLGYVLTELGGRVKMKHQVRDEAKHI